ncbi:uncharacterized protein LOC135703066 [Ochlerotatus camptorhynchus]|uniref:uncharacterized protein LOC135703066 n=1 Tax=Ochlerotatus camptorhynchus TaxID=644619 RepID=UPI0031E45258
MSNVFEGRNEKLIKLVRKHPELYDQQHAKYHDAKRKNQVWNTIGALMEEEGLACKSRWKNIRDQYRKNVKKHGTKTPPYKFSRYLSFLKEFTDGNETEEKSTQSAADSDHDDFFNELIMKSETMEPSAVEAPTDSYADVTGSVPKKATTRIVRRIKRPEWNRISAKPTSSTTSSPRVMEFLLQQLEATQSPSSVDAFLAGIAPTLKNLHPYEWNQAKLEIFSIVHKYELKMLTETSPLLYPDRRSAT